MKPDSENRIVRDREAISEMIFNHLRAEFQDASDDTLRGLALKLQKNRTAAAGEGPSFPRCMVLGELMYGLQWMRGV